MSSGKAGFLLEQEDKWIQGKWCFRGQAFRSWGKAEEDRAGKAEFRMGVRTGRGESGAFHKWYKQRYLSIGRHKTESVGKTVSVVKRGVFLSKNPQDQIVPCITAPSVLQIEAWGGPGFLSGIWSKCPIFFRYLFNFVLLISKFTGHWWSSAL